MGRFWTGRQALAAQGGFVKRASVKRQKTNCTYRYIPWVSDARKDADMPTNAISLNLLPFLLMCAPLCTTDAAASSLPPSGKMAVGGGALFQFSRPSALRIACCNRMEEILLLGSHEILSDIAMRQISDPTQAVTIPRMTERGRYFY